MDKKLMLMALLAWPALGPAQTVPQQTAAAVAPDGQVAPPRYQPLPPVGASALVTELDDWKAANATVGQYPRGHLDILKWERAQPAARPAAPPPREPAR